MEKENFLEKESVFRKGNNRFFGIVLGIVLFLSCFSFAVAQDGLESEGRNLFDVFRVFFDRFFSGITGRVVDEGFEDEGYFEEVEEIMIPPLPDVGREVEEIVEEEVEEIVEEEIQEIEVPETNETGVEEVNETIVEIPETNETISEELNETIIEELNETEVDEEVVDEIIFEEIEELVEARIVNESLVSSRVVIGQQVKWVKKVVVEGEGNFEIDLPKEARDIVVKTGESARRAGEDIEKQKEVLSSAERTEIASLMTGNVIKSSGKPGILNWLSNLLFKGITGKVIYSEALSVSVGEDSLKVDLSDVVSAGEIAIEYFTEAPQAREELIENGKRVIVSGPSELGYTDILAYTILEGEMRVSLNEQSRIRMYWYVDSGEERERISFDAFDLSEDGMIDYIEWNVPHLSEQTFEIILITEAMHLDSEREFIKDVYEEVSGLEDGKSVVIPAGDFVRVVFEKELDERKDITVYAKVGGDVFIINGEEIPREIFLKRLRIEELRGLI
jgi:hypothetical protein